MPKSRGVNNTSRGISVSHDNRDVADALIAVYLAGAGFGHIVTLERTAEVTGVKLSDLFGSLRRRVGSDPDVIVVQPAGG